MSCCRGLSLNPWSNLEPKLHSVKAISLGKQVYPNLLCLSITCWMLPKRRSKIWPVRPRCSLQSQDDRRVRRRPPYESSGLAWTALFAGSPVSTWALCEPRFVIEEEAGQQRSLMFTLVTWISPSLPAKQSLRVQTFRLSSIS